MKRFRFTSMILIMLVAALIPFSSLSNAAGSSREIAVSIDGRFIRFDVPPQMINGRVMVPLRPIFEGLGAQVNWDEENRTVTGSKDDIDVFLRLDETKATVNGNAVTLSAPSTQIDGRTFVPTRFVAESLGADVVWDDAKRQVIIATGAEIVALDNYFFVYNSSEVNAADLDAIRKFSANFKNTNPILFDASPYPTAPQLYDALKAEQQKLGGNVAGIQIFGLANDVPSFSYVHKMKPTNGNFEWDGVEHNNMEKYVTDYLYSTFKNDSKHLTDVSVYGIVQERLPISVIPEWPVSRLPLTKGEIARYIDSYDAYRKQVAGESVPTVVLSAPTQFQDGIAQDDVALFIERLKEEPAFGLFKNIDLRLYDRDLAENLAKENASGVIDLVVGSSGGPEGTALKKDGTDYFYDRESAAGLNANYYTALFWGMPAAKGLDANSIVHDGMAEGKLMNPIAYTIPTYNIGVFNSLWLQVPPPEGETGEDWYDYVAVDKEHLAMDNPLFFIYKYYEAIGDGKSRLQSFFEANAAYAALTEANKHTPRFLFGYERTYSAYGFANLFSAHYLGLADYE